MADRQADRARVHRARRGSEHAAFAQALGRNLRAARERAGVTQEELAGQVGLSRASIANMERGAQAPSVFVLVLLARALGGGLEALVPLELAGSAELALPAPAQSALERVLRGAQRARGSR